MADFEGVASSYAGTTVTPRTGTTNSDTVPAGARVLWHNTGAGAHVVTLTTNNTPYGLDLGDQEISLAAGARKFSYVEPAWADANGRVAVGIDGTANEVTYYVLGT